MLRNQWHARFNKAGADGRKEGTVDIQHLLRDLQKRESLRDFQSESFNLWLLNYSVESWHRYVCLQKLILKRH